MYGRTMSASVSVVCICVCVNACIYCEGCELAGNRSGTKCTEEVFGNHYQLLFLFKFVPDVFPASSGFQGTSH